MNATLERQIISPRYEFDSLNPYQPSVSKNQQNFIDKIKLNIDNNSYTLQHSACPCEANDSEDVIVSEIDRYGIPLTSVVCNRCGTVRFDPYLDEESLADFYTNMYRKMYAMDVDDSEDYGDYIASQSSYSEKLLQFISDSLTPASRLCEVGCGGGGSVKFMQERGYDAIGCDYDVAALQAGRRFGVKHLYYGDLSALPAEQKDAKFDLIYLHHVFEHLDQPLQFLQDIRQYLTPNGKIVLIVPDISRIDQFGHLPALGNLLMYLHIAHKYNFSVDGLYRIANRAGFSVENMEFGSSSKSSSPWSSSPEIWMQISPNMTQENTTNLEPSSRSSKMLKYLQRTETLFSLGLCRGQIAYKLSALASPNKIVSKLRQMMS